MERKLPGKSFPKYGYTSRGCPHTEVKKKKQAKQKPVASRGLQCLGFPLVRFCFFNLPTKTIHDIGPVLSHVISR